MSAFQKLGEILQDLQETLLSLTPGGMARRTTSGSSPITPLFFFCFFALVAAVSLGVFSDICWLQAGAFALFAATLVVSFCVYLYCLWRRPDLLRSENYALATRGEEEKERGIEPETDAHGEGAPPVTKGEGAESAS